MEETSPPSADRIQELSITSPVQCQSQGPPIGHSIQVNLSAQDSSDTSDTVMQNVVSMDVDENNLARRQERRLEGVAKRRAERDDLVSRRALECKAEYQKQKFDKMPSRHYAIHVRKIGGIIVGNVEEGDSEMDVTRKTREAVVFKPFKPYTVFKSEESKKPPSPPPRLHRNQAD